MDRCAVFVDAGYLYAAGGELCCGQRSRAKFDLDVKGFVQALVDAAKDDCGLPILRTYWYDGAKRRIPSPSQQAVAATRNVKLRLGSMNGQKQQKGVDALIYRDLMTLSRERSIAHAYVLSGDEDLREGVQAAQELGVVVTLIGIPPVKQSFNQSRDLVNESDALIVLEKPALSQHFTLRSIPTPPGGTVTPSHSSAPAVPKSAPKRPPDVERRAITLGKDFAKLWRERASETDETALIADRPRIPAPLDAELLRSVETSLQFAIRPHDDVRRAARRGFWQAFASNPAPSAD